MLGTI